MGHGVTIALVVRNEADSLERAVLSSIPRPGSRLQWEVLVVDNASSDGTREAFERIRGGARRGDFRWIQRSFNNLGAARDEAVRAARFPLVAFIDGDCAAFPGWIERLVEALEGSFSDDRVLGVGGGSLPPWGKSPFLDNLFLMLSSGLGSLNQVQARPFARARKVKHLPTCNLLYRKDLLLRCGGFSPAFREVCEDMELHVRASKAGYSLLFLDGAEVAHHHKGGWKGWALKMLRYGRGQLQVARVHPSHLLGIKGVVLGAGFVFLIALFSRPFALLAGLGIWSLLVACYSARLCWRAGRPGLTLSLAGLFLLTQAFYLAGHLQGLLPTGESPNEKMTG